MAIYWHGTFSGVGDYTPMYDYTPEIGSVLSNVAGVSMYIYGGRLYAYASAGSYSQARITDTLPADINCRITVRRKSSNAAGYQWFVCFVDYSNFVGVSVLSDGSVSLYKRVSGVDTTLATGSFSHTVNVDQSHEVRIVGGMLSMYVEGVEILAPTSIAPYASAAAPVLYLANVTDAAADEGKGWHADEMWVEDPPSGGGGGSSSFFRRMIASRIQRFY